MPPIPNLEEPTTFDSIDDNLPAVSDYAFATANAYLAKPGQDPKLILEPSNAELVLGPLFLTGEITRKTLYAYLEQWADGDLPARASRIAAQGVYRVRSPHLNSDVLDYDPERDNQRLGLNLDAISNPDPEMVQRIVRTAAIRWLLDTHEDERERFVKDVEKACKLTPLESDMLDALLQRYGGRFYINASSISTKQERRAALYELAAKMQTRFGEPMVQADPCDKYSALPPLLETMPGPTLEHVIGEHRQCFGDYLPLPQLLLHKQFRADRKGRRRLKEWIAQRKKRLRALHVAEQHIEELTEVGMSDMAPLLKELGDHRQKLLTQIEKLCIDLSGKPVESARKDVQQSTKPKSPPPKKRPRGGRGPGDARRHRKLLPEADYPEVVVRHRRPHAQDPSAPSNSGNDRGYGPPPQAVTYPEPEPTAAQVGALGRRIEARPCRGGFSAKQSTTRLDRSAN